MNLWFKLRDERPQHERSGLKRVKLEPERKPTPPKERETARALLCLASLPVDRQAPSMPRDRLLYRSGVLFGPGGIKTQQKLLSLLRSHIEHAIDQRKLSVADKSVLLTTLLSRVKRDICVRFASTDSTVLPATYHSGDIVVDGVTTVRAGRHHWHPSVVVLMCVHAFGGERDACMRAFYYGEPSCGLDGCITHLASLRSEDSLRSADSLRSSIPPTPISPTSDE